MSYERKPDDAPVTWGELRLAVFLTTKFCVSVASAAAYTPGFQKKADEEIAKAAIFGADLNEFLGTTIVEALGDG